MVSRNERVSLNKIIAGKLIFRMFRTNVQIRYVKFVDLVGDYRWTVDGKLSDKTPHREKQMVNNIKRLKCEQLINYYKILKCTFDVAIVSNKES